MEVICVLRRGKREQTQKSNGRREWERFLLDQDLQRGRGTIFVLCHVLVKECLSSPRVHTTAGGGIGFEQTNKGQQCERVFVFSFCFQFCHVFVFEKFLLISMWRRWKARGGN